MRRVLYVAHPLAPTSDEADAALRLVPHDATNEERAHAAGKPIRVNISRALHWLSWLRRSFPETTFIAPWIAAIQSGEDNADPAQREAGLVDDCAVIERCDGIVLCGSRISGGMRREMEHGIQLITTGAAGHYPAAPGVHASFQVYDLTGYKVDGTLGRASFLEWMDKYQKAKVA